MMLHLVACTLGFLIDRFYGEPKLLKHPVIWIGHYIQRCTTILNKGHHRKIKGAFVALSTVLLTLSITLFIVMMTYAIHPIFGCIVEAILISMALAQKSLAQAADDVKRPLQQGDIQMAREKLSWIVGRDTAHLDEANITRGVVETVSENTSDGVTAPLFYAFLFGATGAWAYKAINTLDSMIAYKNETYAAFGYVAAKMDDVANFIPSRLTGFFILIGTKNSSGLPWKERFQKWRIDAKKHPSPNSGYLEAATAYQLGIQLGGLNYYGGVPSHRQEMGESMYPLTAQQIEATVQQMKRASTLCLFTGLLIGGYFIVT